MRSSAKRYWRWAAVPFGVLYLVLLLVRFPEVVTATNLDADAVSAPVIGQLFSSAPAHASIVLGEFGWYSSLLFLLVTKSLPSHREVWEIAPYAMALAGFALTSWSVWQVAGRWAASLTAVLLVCCAPDTLHLLFSMTQHAPDWFCLGLLGGFAVLLTRRAAALRWTAVVPLSVSVGAIVGVNAASDPLVVIAGLAPFTLALLAGSLVTRGPDSARALQIGFATLALALVSGALTLTVMSAWNVTPEPGLDTTMFATGDKIVQNFKLWWESIAVLGNGDFFGRDLSFASGLAVLCAVLSSAAIFVLFRSAWREVRAAAAAPLAPSRPQPSLSSSRSQSPARLTLMVFWCSSAVLLSVAFVLSATPVDIHADRYLVGLLYAAAAVIPVLAVGHLRSEALALFGTCVFALSGVISIAQGTVTRDTEGFPPTAVAHRVAQLAVRDHLSVGYAGYWNAAPITWATHFRVQVYPVSVCDRGAHLCRFDLHFISSWYTPRRGIGSFLLTDRRLAGVPRPTPDLGRPAAVYHLGRITMYVYPYDLATKIVR